VEIAAKRTLRRLMSSPLCVSAPDWVGFGPQIKERFFSARVYVIFSHCVKAQLSAGSDHPRQPP
jgi:hypothetical protein